MSEKRFRKLQGYMADNNRKYDNGNVYAMDFTEVEDMLNALYEENKELRQKIKHCVYVDVDNANGCMNCKYDKGSICSILNCGTHDYLEGVSECGLKYWEYKDE